MEVSKKELESTLDSTGKLILAFALCLSAFMFVLDYTIANVAIPYIAGGLGVSTSEGTYVITFFAVGNAIFLPMTSWLVKVYGDDKVIIWATILFTFFSFTCAASPNLAFLIVSRFLQGASAGPLIPLSQGILTKIYHKYVDKIGILFSLIVMIAPVVGPVVGGYICVNYTWRWIFYINLPVGALSIVLLMIYARQIKFIKAKVSFDWITFILLLVGMTCLQLVLDKGQQWDWFRSTKVIVFAVIASLCIIYMIVWSFTYQHPLFKLRLFKNRFFSAACILIFFAYSLYFAAVTLIPLWLEEVMGYTAYNAGLAVAPLGLGALIGVAILGRLTKYLPYPVFIATGFLVMSFACFYTGSFVPTTSFFQVGYSRMLLGLGLSLWIVPTISIPAMKLPHEDLDSGLAMFHFLRSLSGGVGTAVYITMYTRRGYQQHQNIVYNFNEYIAVARDYYNDIFRLIPNEESATRFLGNVIDSQSATFAYCEVNTLMGWICFVLMFFSLLTIEKKSKIENK